VDDFVWTDERILLFWTAGLLVPLFFTIGVISSMCWAGGLWRNAARNRGAKRLNRKYPATARPAAAAPPRPRPYRDRIYSHPSRRSRQGTHDNAEEYVIKPVANLLRYRRVRRDRDRGRDRGGSER
jgi:hypothetical protein